MYSGKFIVESLNTLRASRADLLMVKLFGRRSTSRNGDYVVEIAEWRGEFYVIDCYKEEC